MRWVDLGGTWIKEGLISDQCAEYVLRKNSKFDFGWATMPKVPEVTVDPIVAKKNYKISKIRSKKNLRKAVEYGLKRLSSKIIDHIQEATASEVQ